MKVISLLAAFPIIKSANLRNLREPYANHEMSNGLHPAWLITARAGRKKKRINPVDHQKKSIDHFVTLNIYNDLNLECNSVPLTRLRPAEFLYRF
ncbi:MAG: hypothetical protein DI535_22100 [Citrobacter freundii]|nr:MAG: hypothetical protein DI535_22100 [Citrobacter freundii]